jgi:hypothetical protein
VTTDAKLRLPERDPAGNLLCDRCEQPMTGYSMSFFNTQLCCFKCLREEREHPDYEKAHAAEVAAVEAGDYNYPGVGLPPDLGGSR